MKDVIYDPIEIIGNYVRFCYEEKTKLLMFHALDEFCPDFMENKFCVTMIATFCAIWSQTGYLNRNQVRNIYDSYLSRYVSVRVGKEMEGE